MKSHVSLLAAAVALSCLAPATAWADVKAGVDAWAAKRYGDAIKEWRPLAEKGDPDAQFNMGQAYKLGRGVPADLKLAQSWYEKAAQQGHEQAQANLGLILFQNGERQAAMPWIEKASSHGDPRAQYVLGTALFNGDIVAKDWPRAYALMSRAAAQGLPQAATSLSEMNSYIPLSDRQRGEAMAKQMEASASAPSRSPARKAPSPQTSRIASAAMPPSTPKPAVAKPAPAKPATSPQAVAKPALAASKPAPAASKPAPAASKPAPATVASATGKWRVQLGAFGSAASARGQWAQLSKRVTVLGDLQPSYEPAGALTRLRVGPLANRAAADKVCAAAKAAGQACFPVAP